MRVSDEKNPVEAAVEQAVELGRDLFVYAPIGLLFEGPALLPTLIERGKNQVATARVLGKYAAEQGQAEATKQLAKLAKLSENGGLRATRRAPARAHRRAGAHARGTRASRRPTPPRRRRLAAPPRPRPSSPSPTTTASRRRRS